MTKVPTIKGSAQARLLLYRTISLKLTKAEQKLLSSRPSLWGQILDFFETELASETQDKSDQATLAQAFDHIDIATRTGLQKQVERLSGKSLWIGTHSTELLDAFVGEHTKLIKSVVSDQLDKIGLSINRGIREGRLYKDIVKDICQETKLSKRRAQLIARNAALQYSGALTKHHQVSSGIKSYIWQSCRDERVRDAHRKYDGEIFNWDEPGPHPRSEVNCRCDAVPHLD